ncbi:MAG: hypothetical protein ABI315_06410 [Bacteroidia bacterium]
MSTTTTPQKDEKKVISPMDKQKNVENHKKIATHLEAAAKHHEDAAKHHEADNHDKAAMSTIKAQGHLALANEAQKEDVKNHATKN